MTSDLFRRYINIVAESSQQLTEDSVTAFASKAHDEWRQGWIKQNAGKSVPRVKKNSDGTEGDINVPFEKLHPDWQKENLAAGRAAAQSVKQFPNDEEKAAELIHIEWMKRNPKADYNAAQHVPYDQLPEPEKEKDRVHVRTMKQLMGQKSSVAAQQQQPQQGQQPVAESRSLKDYIAESERAHNQPVTGDYFEINIKEDTLFETWVCDETEDGIVIYADHAGMQLLESHGYISEELQESHDMEYEIDSDEDSVDVVDQGEYDQEGDMAKDDLATIVRAARRLTGMLDDDENMPEWVQAKINKAADYVDTAADYIESNKERKQGVAETGPAATAAIQQGLNPTEVGIADRTDKYNTRWNAINAQKAQQMLAKGLDPTKTADWDKFGKQGVAEGSDDGYDDGIPKSLSDPPIFSITPGMKVFSRGMEEPHGTVVKVVDGNTVVVRTTIGDTLMDIREIDRAVAEGEMDEAKYQGREVPLGKPMKGDVKKSKVYVRGPKGNVVKVNFGQKGMRIKKNIPGRRKNFRARHNCDNPGPRHKARYWSCRAW